MPTNRFHESGFYIRMKIIAAFLIAVLSMVASTTERIGSDVGNHRIARGGLGTGPKVGSDAGNHRIAGDFGMGPGSLVGNHRA